MADVFVDSGGSNTSPYDTWAKAATTLLTGVGQLAAGDRLIIAHDHGETSTASVTFVFPGTLASPNVVISSTNAGGGSTVTYTKATSPQFQQITTTSSDITWTGWTISHGIYLEAADNFTMNGNGASPIFFDCSMTVGALAAGVINSISSGHSPLFKNCDLLHLSTNRQGQFLEPQASNARIRVVGGTISSNAAYSASDALAVLGQNGCGVEFDSVDISGCDHVNLYRVTAATSTSPGIKISARNCKLHANTGFLYQDTASDSVNQNYVFHNCDSANTVYRQEEIGYLGSMVQDTGIYRTAGASNGTTSFSHKITATADAGDLVGYRYKLADLWVDVSTAKTFTVEIAQDGTTTALQDDEVWIEVEYPDDLSSLSHVEDDRVANVTATPADQATSTEAWTGLSGTNVKQACSVTTSNAGKEGPCSVWINLAKPSTTLYVDPKVDVS